METKLDKIIDLLSNAYYRDINFSKIEDKLIKYICTTENDPFLRYIAPDERSVRPIDILGMKLQYTEDGFYVIESFIDDNMYKKLKKGDVVLLLNDCSINRFNATKMVYELKNDVTITALRGFGTDKIHIVQDKRKMPNVIEDHKKQGVELIAGENKVYIKISLFSPESITNALSKLADISITDNKELVIDLRENTGGSLNIAFEFCSHFITCETDIIFIKDKERKLKRIRINEKKPVIRFKSYEVWVSEMTMSAAEVTTIFFKKNMSAVIKGRCTFGKGVLSKCVQFADGSMIYIPIYEFFDLLGHPVNKHGIQPDITESDEEFKIEIKKLC